MNILDLLKFLESLGAKAGPVIAAIKTLIADFQALIALLGPTPAPTPGPLKAHFDSLSAAEKADVESRVGALFGVAGGPLADLLALLIQYAPAIIALLQSLGWLKPTPAPTP